MKSLNKKNGVIGTIVLIVVALIILGYYNISFKSIVQSPLVLDNLSYAWELVVWGTKNFWHLVIDPLYNMIKAVTPST